MTAGFDRVADELATTRGAATGKKATLAGLGLIIGLCVSAASVLVAILIAVLS